MRRDPGGFTMLEVLIALFLIMLGVLAAAPLFTYAVRENATGADLGEVGAVAVERMERLRAEPFGNLTAGGDLESDVAEYSDTTDSEYVVRWLIIDNASPTRTKTITLRAMATDVLAGPRREFILSGVRGM